jgi:sugar lactone lactonase YvrE
VVEREISLPVQRPTSCTFGGPGLDQLYITSASVDLSQQDLKEQPLAGDLFVLQADVRGLAEPKFLG